MLGRRHVPRSDAAPRCEPERQSARRGAEAVCDQPPRGEVRVRAGQMEHEATDGADSGGAELEQGFPERADLRASEGRPVGPQPQFLHHDIGRRRQEHTEVIGPEARAARAIDLEPVVEFLDAILNVPPADRRGGARLAADGVAL